MTANENGGRSLYVADLHFSHKGILRSTGRPFQDAAEMDEALIRLWRERVGPQDRVYILGDLFAWSKHPEAVLERLTGRLILVVGNHDLHWLPYTRPGRFFEGVCPQLTVQDRGRTLALTHVPRKELLTGDVDYLLYGHLHNNPWHSPLWPWLKQEPRALNVGVDVALAAGAAPAPASLEEWIEYNRIFNERSVTQ